MKKIITLSIFLNIFLFYTTSSAQTVCTDYTVNPGTTITTAGGVTYNTIINVPDTFTITDIHVTIDVDHTYDADLDISLISPTSTSVNLSTGNGVAGDDYKITVFDDAAGTAITAGSPPYNGTFSPEGNLSDFNGENANGDWTLRITDTRAGDGGTINSITLNICYDSTSIGGHTGPGGVGLADGTSNLVLWLNPDKGANTGSLFTDQSGNSFNFNTGNATLNTSDVNGYDSYSFNGSSNYFEKSYEASLNPSAFSVFTTSNVTSSGNYKAVISNRDSPPGVATRGFILYARPTSNNWSFWTGRDAGSWEKTDGSNATVGNWAVQNLVYENTSNGKRLFVDNTISATNSHSMTANTSRPFRVGAGRNESTTPDYYFNGKIGEVIMFDAVVNSTEQIIVNNYLAAKYNFSLSSNDYYSQDNSGNGNFDHNVAGIGQITLDNQHTDSQGTGIIRINTASDLGDDEFLFWGEETKNATYNFTTDSSDYMERLNSKWRVSKRNDLGTVSLAVAAADLDLTGMQSCATLRVIVSSSSTFATKTSYDFSLSGGIYTATGVSFTDGDYFTLEYQDLIVVDATTAYNGAGASNVPDTSDVCFKLLVKATADGTPSLTENAYVREIEVEAGGKLVVDTGIYLQVENAINNSGDIRLIGNSQLLQDEQNAATSNTGTGHLYMDQLGTLTNVYQSGYWTSPVTTNGTTFTISGVLKDGTTATSAISNPSDITFTDIHTLDGDTTTPITISGRWLAKLVNDVDWTRQISPTAVTFNPGEGWNMKSTGAAGQNFTFKGILNDGDYTSSIDQNKLSLIGNPYPSALDADQFITDNVEGGTGSTAIVGTLYFWNDTNSTHTNHYRGSYDGDYATRVSGLGAANGTGKTPSQYIGVGQAFFVWRSLAGTGTIDFNNGQRAFQTVGGSNQFFSRSNNSDKVVNSKTTNTKKTITKSSIARRTASDFPFLRLGFEFDITPTNKYHRQVAVGFRGLTTNYDNGYDAEMFDQKPSDLALKTDDWTSPMVITGIENFDKDIEIPLTIFLDANRDVTFSLDESRKITTPVFVKDSISKVYYKISDANATINLDAGTYSDRFFITFKDDTVVEEEIDYLKVFFKNHSRKIIIKKNQAIKIRKVVLFKLNGRKIQQWKIKKQRKVTRLKVKRKVRDGLYIVKIKTNKGVIIKKILIN